MQTFECIVQFGHMGAGKSLEKALRVRARDIFQAMRLAKSLPGVKKGGLQQSGASVLKVSLVQQ
jgi:hypothetical protein